MNVPKKTALFMLVASSVFLALNLGIFIYLHERVIIDFNYPPRQISARYAALYLIIGGVLTTIIFIGLYIALKRFKEAKWIGISVLAFLIVKIFVILQLAIFQFYPDTIKTHIQEIAFLVGRLPLWFMLLALLFVKNKIIKPYFLGYTITSIALCFTSAFGPILYDDFNIRWALINSDALLLLAYFPVVLLFFKCYILPQQTIGLQDSH